MNILVTGAKGQLGSEIRKMKDKITNVNFIFSDVNIQGEEDIVELDIIDFNGIKSFFKENKIDFIINSAAYTAVDKAESDHKTARLINVYGVSNLAEMSDLHDIPIIHISSDYVYNGETNRPITEEFPENPQSIYGKTKFDGDEILMATTDNFAILRTSWLYSSFGNNFLKTMMKLGKEKDTLKVVFDQVGTPTHAKDLAGAIISIIQDYKLTGKLKSGIYHYSNEGVCSWYDFAVEIMKIANLNCKIDPILSIEYPTAAARPQFSVLSKNKIKNTFGIKIPHWSESLKECISLLQD